jgi:hypothetical protein
VETKRYALEAVGAGAGLDIKTLPSAFMAIYDIETEDRNAFLAEMGSPTATEKLRLSDALDFGSLVWVFAGPCDDAVPAADGGTDAFEAL